MRKIKFRAWDGEKFRESFVVHQSNGIAMIEEVTPLGQRHMEFKHDWIVQQYTGLKDNNGKEIYEGDILREVSLYDGMKTKTTVVSWAKAYSGFQWCECEVGENEPEDYYGGINCEYKEVVGNICEDKNEIYF